MKPRRVKRRSSLIGKLEKYIDNIINMILLIGFLVGVVVIFYYKHAQEEKNHKTEILDASHF